jgi:hypothetical protein
VLEEDGEDKMAEKLANEEVFEHIGQKSRVLNNILH